MKFVRLIVDGAAMGNPGKSGWACILKHGTRERVLTGSEPQSTNNKMELLAALRGLQALKEPVRSRSRYGLAIRAARNDPVPGEVEGQRLGGELREVSAQPRALDRA